MTCRILAIDTATDWLSVAILDDEELIVSRRSEARMQHAASLLPTLHATLEAAATRLDAVDALAISTGPGSFTSLRIGLATIKGLAFRRSFESVGVSTLEAMALSAWPVGRESDANSRPGDEPVLALLDARRGEWYAGAWTAAESSGGLPEPFLPEGLYAPDRLALLLDRPIRVVCPEAGAWRDAFESAGVELSEHIRGDAARPSAEWVGRLAKRRLAKGEGIPASRLVARYLRRAEAEAKRLGGPVERGEHADVGAGSERT